MVRLSFIGGIVLASLVLAGCLHQGLQKELRLSDFPEVFKENTLIIIGDKASEIEVQAANDIASYLEEETGNKPLVKKYSEVSNEDKRNYNLIVVGTPESNEMLKEIYAMADVLQVNESFPGEGKGVLEIARNSWNEEKAMLLVAGSDEWGVKESHILLKHCKKVNLSHITTEKFKEVLIGKVVEFIKNYHPIYLYKKHVSDWIILNSATEIPYHPHQQNILSKYTKNPENYTNIVHPPKASIVDHNYLVTLYTWIEYGGVLLRWDVTVKSGCLDYVKATVVDTFVGDFEPVPAEGRLVMSGDVIVGDPDVKGVCVEVS